MKIDSKVVMRLSSIFIAILTIYVVLLWEPSLENEKSSDVSTVIDELENENNELDKNELEEIYSTETLNNKNIYTNIDLIVKFENIEDKLSLDEKRILNNILSKLSVIDSAKINEILNGYTNDSMKNALEFLEKRLSEKDYRYIEGILGQYLDFI